jgi:hypothetical protein
MRVEYKSCYAGVHMQVLLGFSSRLYNVPTGNNTDGSNNLVIL